VALRVNAPQTFAMVKHPANTNGASAKLSFIRLVNTIPNLRFAPQPFAKVKHKLLPNGSSAELKLQRAIVNTISTLSNAPQTFAMVINTQHIMNSSSAKGE